jgi:hypothetical protein
MSSASAIVTTLPCIRLKFPQQPPRPPSGATHRVYASARVHTVRESRLAVKGFAVDFSRIQPRSGRSLSALPDKIFRLIAIPITGGHSFRSGDPKGRAAVIAGSRDFSH